MKCSECHAENPTDQKYCGECGAQINKVCPGCGHQNPPKYKFCGECGHDLTPSCQITIYQNGLILDVNRTCADLLAREESELIGKPITLFIHPEDLVIFFTHRNTLFSSGKNKEAFEIGLLGKDGGRIHARFECGLVYDKERDVQFMRMAIIDITEKRLALDELQSKKDLQKIILSMSSELIRRPGPEIDLGIIRALKTIGVFSEVDRSYIYQFHENQSNMSITHEWRSEGITTQDKRLRVLSEKEIPDIFFRLKRQQRIIVDDIADLPMNEKASATKFHIKGIRSFLCFPMRYGDQLFGLIGFDSLKRRNAWQDDVMALLNAAGEIILNAIARGKNGKMGAGPEVGEKAIRLAGSVTPDAAPRDDAHAAVEMHEIYDGPIELQEIPMEARDEAAEAESGGKAESPAEWSYRKGAPEDPSKAQKVFKQFDGVRVACPRCGRKTNVSISEIDAKGNALLVKCICAYEFHILLELRNFFRKKVRFEGFFVPLEPGKIITDSDRNWGGVTIKNLSKFGIGFVTSKRHPIKRGDEFKVKFTLDNSARTLITKDVVVKTVDGDYVGSQFLGEDKQDITLGFYLL